MLALTTCGIGALLGVATLAALIVAPGLVDPLTMVLAVAMVAVCGLQLWVAADERDVDEGQDHAHDDDGAGSGGRDE